MFKGNYLRHWQMKMHILLTTLKVVYVLSTLMPQFVKDETLEQTRKRCKWENDDHICHGHILNGIMEMKPNIKNMTLNEYLEYEAEKERQLWDNVRSRRSPTNYDEADVDSFYHNKRAENMKRMGLDIVQDSIYEQDNNLEKDQEDGRYDRDTFDMWDITVEDVERIRKFLTPNVLDIIKDVIEPFIPTTLHTTPPNEDYVAPATKPILD
nr:zinc finger, CCHC-type [Tanacetum cinerariifolium]